MTDHATTTNAPPLPPVRRTPGMRPAFVVAGAALGLLLLFGVVSVVTSSPTKPPKAAAPTVIRGTGLTAVPGASALSAIRLQGEPPTNIVDAVDVPRGTVMVDASKNDGGSAQFDRQVRLTLPGATETEVIDFYRAVLPRLGWQVVSKGAPANGQSGYEILGKQAGNDGWFWEIGATIAPTTFSTGGAEATPVTLRLIQEPDPD